MILSVRMMLRCLHDVKLYDVKQCGTIPSLDGILEVLDGINTLENNAVIPKNAVGNDTKIQELPSTTCPLYLIHLHQHVCYT